LRRYQISEADAAVIQPKLWNNPTFSFEQGVYNPGNQKMGSTFLKPEKRLYPPADFVLAPKEAKGSAMKKSIRRLPNTSFMT